MLDPHVVENIRKLLATGMSQRMVQKLTGVSRGRIILIQHGKYPDYEAQRQLRKQDSFDRSEPARRCSTCGHLVYMPCMICRARAAKNSASRPFQTLKHQKGEILQLELHGDQQERYQRIRGRILWPLDNPNGPHLPNALPTDE